LLADKAITGAQNYGSNFFHSKFHSAVFVWMCTVVTELVLLQEGAEI